MRMKLRSAGLGCCLLIAQAFAAPSVDTAKGNASEEFRWRGWIPTGALIEVNGVVGNVFAERSKTDEVEIVAVKQGGETLDDVQIEVIEHNKGITICAVYPSLNPDQPFECRPTQGGGFRVASASENQARVKYENGGGGDVKLDGVRVDFIVRVPSRVRFLGRTLDGNIDVDSLDREIEAHSVLGDVHVHVPKNAANLVQARSTEGKVYSDFPLRVTGECSNSGVMAKGAIGSGKRSLTVRTTKGSIRLTRAAS
jgi:hypothetical protein